MLRVKSFPVELRGIAHKTNQKNRTVYYIINVEDIHDGTPYALYCPDSKAFPEGLTKGDKISITFDVRVYNGNERLIASAVERCVNE